MNYFVTQNYLITNGFINANVDTNIYKSLIEFSAKAYVKPIIGTYFFNDLFDRYNSQTLTSNETTVVEIMQKAIAFRVKGQTAIDTSYQITNKGIQKQSDDSSSPADKSEVSWIYDHNISHAILFQDELSKWLNDNKDLYPNFISDLNNDSKIKKNFHNNKGKDFNEGIGFFFI